MESKNERDGKQGVIERINKITLFFFKLCNRPIIKMEWVRVLFTSDLLEIWYDVSGEYPFRGWKKISPVCRVGGRGF